MAIDLGNSPPSGSANPTLSESMQIKTVLQLNNVENIALSSWTGSSNLQLSSSQIIDFSEVSSPWNSTYTTVKANSAAWGAGVTYQSATAPDPAAHPSWLNTNNGALYQWHGIPPAGTWVNVSHEQASIGIDPSLLTGIVAGYRIGDTTRTGTSINTWTDITGNGHDASFTGTKSTVKSSSTGEYAIGGAIYSVPSAIPADFADMTIICVFGSGREQSYNTVGINQTFALTNPLGGASGGGGVLFTSGTAQFYNATRQAGCLRNPKGISAVTLRFGTTECSIRSNGITDTVAANGPSTNNEFGHIWGWGGGSFLWGNEMVELYFFDRKLTDLEVAGIEFKLGITPPTTALHVIGDSFVAGTGATTAENAYARLLEQSTGLSLVAHGGAGSRLLVAFNQAHLLKTIQSSIDAGLNPTVVFDIGKNDIAAGVTSATLQTTYESYCNDITAAGAPLVCVTIPPRGLGFTAPADVNFYETQRLLFNTWLRAQTSMYDALADVAANSNIGDFADVTGSYYDGDQIHLSDTGHALWATIVKGAIDTL